MLTTIQSKNGFKIINKLYYEYKHVAFILLKIYFKLKGFPHVSETFIVNNIIYAKSKGYDVSIFVDSYYGIENSSQSELLKKYNIEKDIVKPFRFSPNKLNKLIQVCFILSHFRIFKYVFAYYKLKQKKNLTPLATLFQYRKLGNGLVHVHFNDALKPLVELSEIGFVNPKCIITFHGYDAFLDNKETFQKKYAAFYEKHVLAVTTNSNYLKNEVINLGVEASKIKVVPIGVDFKKFKGQQKQLKPNKSIKLITVGRLVQLKGHIYVIRALAILKELRHNVNYIIIGSGNEELNLKNEVNKLNLTNNVHFQGAKSQEEIIPLLQQSDVFVMPSTSDHKSGRREAFGSVSIEAQAMGLPVIGFNSGGFPDTIIEGETGFAVEDRNEKAMAEAIEKLLVNYSRFEKMSKNGIKHAQTFDFQFTTQKYLDLYTNFT